MTAITDSSIGGEYHRAYYYDYKGREIQRVECDFEGNILRTTSRYDLIGNLLAQRESYTHGGTTDVLDRTFEYDSRSRMTKETAQFNDGEQAVVAYTYDDLGQLTGKTYGTGAHAIHETMDYNMQGWLTEKSSELFEMRLRYHDPESHLSDRASYTGNISSWWWKHRLINNDNDSENRLYAFTYDDLARLVDTELYLDDSYGASNEFVENGITYDKNSNIITLNRSSLSSDDMKNYLFSYSGNQRIKDETSNSDYEYDANGNIHRDALTGFYIYYNLLNLPTVIYTEGDMGLYYTYLSDGTKIEVCGYDDNEPTRYAGSLVYNDGTFESASFGGGRIVGTNNGTNSEVHYFLTDHLGSTRVVAKVTPTGREDLDRKDYYPFGKEWTQSGMPTSDNRYTFSGKEQQHLRGQVVNYADFEARFYDSDGIHFLQQDPLLEKYFRIGQYNYCAGNPIRFIDSDGRKIRENSKHLKPHMQRILNRTPTGRIQYNKMVNNASDISVKRVEGYYVNESGAVDRNRMGNASLTAIMKDTETGEIIGGKIDITLYMEAIKDDAKKRGMRVDDREAATLAEEIEHTEAENIQLQIEEQEREEKEKQEMGAEIEIPYEQKESEQEAHIFRDRVLRESGVRP